MKRQTSLNYHQRIGKVLHYIVEHPGDDLSIESLAGIAHFSPFHFHRVFRAITGETIGETLKRVRLGIAGYRLRNSEHAISTVALDCGYESVEAFSRAFRKGFGLSPSAYRRTDLPPVLFIRHSRVIFDPTSRDIQLITVTENENMKLRIETKPAIHYAYVTHIGPYQEAGNAFQTLLGWAKKQDIDLDSEEMFSQSYDNPEDVAAEQLRSEACITLPNDMQGEDAVKIRKRESQRYAVYTLKGHYEGIQNAYQDMVLKGLAETDEEIDDKPFVEIFKNDCTSLPPNEWLTDLCIPIK